MHTLSFRHFQTLRLFLVGLVSLLGWSATGRCQGTPTSITGSLTIALPAGEPALVSVPFVRSPAFVGRIASVSGKKVRVSPAPNWQPSEFVYAGSGQPNHYFAIIGANPAALTGTLTVTQGAKTVVGVGTAFDSQLTAGDGLIVAGRDFLVTKINSATSLTLDRVYGGPSGSSLAATFGHSPREGRAYAVKKNTLDTLKLVLDGDDLSVLTPGTSIQLVPAWTLGTVFPAARAGQWFVASASGVAGTTVQVAASADDSDGPPAEATYFFQDGAWRQSGHDPAEVHDDDVLAPGRAFTVQNPAGHATSLQVSGRVWTYRQCVPLVTDAAREVNNTVGLLRPVPIRLDILGLLANHAFVKTKANAPGDLLGFQPTQGGQTAYYYLDKKGWHLNGGDPAADLGATTVPAGAGIIINKVPQPNGTDLWSDPANFLLPPGQ